MKLLLMIGSIAAPMLMILSQKKLKLRLIYNVAAILSGLVFGNIAAIAIYEIIKDQTVFMTNIHSIFLNPFFLLTGSYLGVYVIYRLVLLMLEER